MTDVPVAAAALPSPADDDASEDQDDAWSSPGRQALLVLGTVTWLFMGFRFGVQVVGGPVGYLLFLGVLGFVGAFWRTRLSPPAP